MKKRILLVASLFLAGCASPLMENESTEKSTDAINKIPATMPPPPPLEEPVINTVPTEKTEDVSVLSSPTYKDGTYSAVGNYTSPAGTESINVEITLKNNHITSAILTPNATNDTAKKWQHAYSAGISEKIVGKSLDDIGADIDVINGSSLTGIGFKSALAEINMEAQL